VKTCDVRALRFVLLGAGSVVAGVLMEAIALHGRGSGLFALAGLAAYAYFATRGLRLWRNGECTCLHGPECWCQEGFGEHRKPRGGEIVDFHVLRRTGSGAS
jgi:hypothetical protein